MKEIKFRVWDKNIPTFNEAMYGSEASGEMVPWEYVRESSYLLSALSGAYPIMQYTGLKDKNGIEIYEGDILKCWLKYQSYKPTFIEDVKVIDLDNTLPFSREFNIENKTYKDRVGACEVIGNIYDNPELLDRK